MSVLLEPIPDRPAWEARVDGQRVGIVFRERKAFRAIPEGDDTPLDARFNSREAAARALGRRAGFDSLGEVIEDTPRRGRGTS
jgi:hypothetical protein